MQCPQHCAIKHTHTRAVDTERPKPSTCRSKAGTGRQQDLVRPLTVKQRRPSVTRRLSLGSRRTAAAPVLFQRPAGKRKLHCLCGSTHISSQAKCQREHQVELKIIPAPHHVRVPGVHPLFTAQSSHTHTHTHTHTTTVKIMQILIHSAFQGLGTTIHSSTSVCFSVPRLQNCDLKLQQNLIRGCSGEVQG
jgi:hypothetical protein